MPRPGQVLGLVGTNGIGKSTALKILSGKLKPNLGRYDNPPDWEEILKYFRGSELQSTYYAFFCGGRKWILTTHRLLYQGARRQLEGCREASVCGPDPQSRQRSGQECQGFDQGSSPDGQHGTHHESSWYATMPFR